jgi:hypothetical protein
VTFTTKVQENLSRIPKIIIQTWKTNIIPTKNQSTVESVKNINPDFKYLFFSDDDIDNFLSKQYPDYYTTYVKLPVVIQKIDFFRYIAVYHYGGFYFDIDMEALKPLDGLLEYHAVFPIDHNVQGDMCSIPRFAEYCDKPFIGQFAFGARRKNEFIKVLVDNIHNNIDSILDEYSKLENKKDLDFVYRTTGPDYVTKLYYGGNYPTTKVKILEYPEDQHFGEYAKHLWMGSWKK